jgi:hypothetical protein
MRWVLVAAALMVTADAAKADGSGARGGLLLSTLTWSGVYSGLQAGGAWGDTGWTFPFVESFKTVATASASPK